MNPIVKNTLAVIAGVVIGSIANLGLLETGYKVIPLPEGAETSTMEGVAEAIKSFTPKHFIFPFLAHSVGTLIGAFVTAKLAAGHHMKFAIGIGVWFLLGGITMVFLAGGPWWFIAADLVAYVPMGYFGGALAGPKTQTVEEV